jgi:hypothetical protein
MHLGMGLNMRIAIIDSTTHLVRNTILGGAELAQSDTTYVVPLNEGENCEEGFAYDPNATPRFTGTPRTYPRRWTAYQFLLRFTAEERAAFRAAALTDANVADFQQLAQAAQEVVSDDPMTVSGMNYLVAVGLLTADRRDEILS